MKKNSIWKTLLAMAICAPPPGASNVGLTPQAQAQSEAFPMGTAWADMHEPDASLSVVNLPTHPGVPNTYQGTTAPTRSQMVRTNGDGCVLFFAVDGNLYDHEGYLMADVVADPCERCLEPGIMEMISVPVPGHCHLYYIFSARRGDDPDWNTPHWSTRVQVALLDLSAQNHWFPSRKGDLVNLVEDMPTGITLDTYDDEYVTPASEYVAWLGWSFKGVSNTPMLRAIDPTGNGDLFWLYLVGTQAVVQYKITATGIDHVNAGMTGGGHYQPVQEQWGGMGDKPYYRDATVAINYSNQIVLAMTDDYLQGWSSGNLWSQGHGPVLIMRFNASTGALINTTEIPFGTGGLPDFGSDLGNVPPGPGAGLTGGPGGIAWIDNGTKLLIEGEARSDNGNSWVYHVGVFDLAGPTWTDLTDQLNAQNNAPNYSYTRLSANWESGPVAAYYLPHSGGLARIGGLGTNPYWQPSVSVSDPVTTPVFAGFVGDGFYHPRFINAQVRYDGAHLTRLNDPACCQTWNSHLGYFGFSFPQAPATVHWSATDNPFGNCDEVTFMADLVVPAGIHLIIDHMTLHFAPSAQLTIRTGGKVEANYSLLTNVPCMGPRWPGSRVEGLPTDQTQSIYIQGYLRLWYSEVRNAEKGVWCSRDGQPGYYGGVVRAYHSRFTDCIEGARIEKYHRFASGDEQPNKCYFSNTRFSTTANWPDPAQHTPKSHIYLRDVNMVSVLNCSFENSSDQPVMDPQHRGFGIRAFDATFNCQGAQDYTNHFFRRLSAGISAESPDPMFTYEVNGMYFDRNLGGLYDFYGTNSLITNNKFVAMTSTVQLNYLTFGMYLYHSRGYTVERNTFWDIDFTSPQEVGSVGIYFKGPQPTENQIYDNEFHDLVIGNVSEGKHDGTAVVEGVEIKTGLQWLCGLYVGELYDQLLMSIPSGTLRVQQGELDLTATAGNVFSGAKDCLIRFEPKVFASHPPYEITYCYYANNQSADSRPECVEDGNGQSLTSTGDYYNLVPTPYSQVPFDHEVHCANGVLDLPPHGVLLQKEAYAAKQAELHSAVEAYEGVLDHGEKEEVRDAINADPAWPSYQLRSYLLAKSPLSEAAILQAINRAEPMDPWHLSQVLIANSRLSGTIWAELDHTGILSPFFYNLVREHATNPSIREVLMDEVNLRSFEKDQAQRRLVIALSQDSTYAGKLDTLMSTYSNDTLGYGQAVAYQLALSHQRSADIAAMETALAQDKRFDLVRALGAMEVALNHDWNAASTADRAQLAAWAWGDERLGSSMAWGILLAIDATDSLPNGTLPFEYRSLVADGQEKQAAAVPVAAYPNPARDRVMITFPAEIQDGMVEVLDSRGRAMRTERLTAPSGFVEVDVRGWSDGLYLARVLDAGRVIGETRFTVVR